MDSAISPTMLFLLPILITCTGPELWNCSVSDLGCFRFLVYLVAHNEIFFR